jgi:hypothetical protein
MVHALEELRRVLVIDGVLIDLRPLGDRWPVEVFSARETRQTGTMTDLPSGQKDDNAANQAMAEGERRGWFLRERETLYTIHYIWDTASEMEEWVDVEWEGFVGLEEETRRATRTAWALGDADSRVRVEVKVLITRWKKL